MAIDTTNEELKQRFEWNKDQGAQTFLQGLLALNSLASMPRVVIISGASSTAKELYAFGYLGLVYCQQKKACGECPECKSLVGLYSPNLLYVDFPEEKNLKVDVAESLQQHLYLSSENKEKPRAVIVKDIERLTPQAANRLLKILEEPPENTCIIFTTSSPLKVLKTIHSRCAKYRLPNTADSLPVDDDLRSFVTKLVEAKSAAQIYTHLESDLPKIGSHAHMDVVDAVEVAINDFYRKISKVGSLMQQDAAKVLSVRQKLLDVRKLRSSLNIRLILEMVFLESTTEVGMI